MSTTILETAVPISALSQALGRAAFAAALLSLVALVALHVLKPELHPSWHMVSEYAVGRHGWVMTICFAGLALGCAALALALIPRQPSILGWIGIVLLVGTTIGLAVAALFPTDPITVAPSDASPTAKLHALAVLIGNSSFVLALLVLSISLYGDATWASLRLALLLLTALAWASLIAMIAIAAILLPRLGGFGPDVMIGWPNRLLMLAYAGWVAVAAWPLAWGRGA